MLQTSKQNELGLQIRVRAGLRSEALKGGAFLPSPLTATAAADEGERQRLLGPGQAPGESPAWGSPPRAEGLGITCQEPGVSASPLLLTSLDLHFLETSGLQSPLLLIHQHPLVYPVTEGPANLVNGLYSVLEVQRSALGQHPDPPSLGAQEVGCRFCVL